MATKEITEIGAQTKLLVSDAHHESITQLTIVYLDRKLDVCLDQDQLTALIEVLQQRVH